MDMGLGDMGGGGEFDFLSWYTSIPPVSRIYFTSAFLTTSFCAMDLLNPYILYFDYNLIIEGQVWRLLSSFLFFGLFSIDFVFHMYFLIRHCRQLEEGDFRGKPSSFVLMLVFGISCICMLAPFCLSSHPFLGSALTFMMTYVWGRRNEDVRMAMFGVITFTAPYLAWVLVLFNFLVGNSVRMSFIGIGVGHTYYVLQYVYPVLAEVRGWKVKKIMEPPRWLKYICGERDGDDVILREHNDLGQHLHME